MNQWATSCDDLGCMTVLLSQQFTGNITNIFAGVGRARHCRSCPTSFENHRSQLDAYHRQVETVLHTTCRTQQSRMTMQHPFMEIWNKVITRMWLFLNSALKDLSWGAPPSDSPSSRLLSQPLQARLELLRQAGCCRSLQTQACDWPLLGSATVAASVNRFGRQVAAITAFTCRGVWGRSPQNRSGCGGRRPSRMQGVWAGAATHNAAELGGGAASQDSGGGAGGAAPR